MNRVPWWQWVALALLFVVVIAMNVAYIRWLRS